MSSEQVIMKKQMFRFFLFSVLFFCLIPVSALAKGTPGIEKTPHNLSSGAVVDNPMYASANEDEICIFCHTPHGGSLKGPLWNRDDTSTTYTHYTSATLSTKVAETRIVNVYPESMLCLSCHDGSVAVHSILNISGEVPTGGFGDTYIIGLNLAGASKVAAKIGDSVDASGNLREVSNDLMDDHPISFKYKAVYDDPTNTGALRTIADAESLGVRFFPANGTDAEKRLECSSCHDPHVDYDAFGNENSPTKQLYAPFLITPNTGSALCLACHIK